MNWREAKLKAGRVYLEELMERHGHNAAAAAREAGVNRTHFFKLLSRHGVGHKPAPTYGIDPAVARFLRGG